MTVRQSEDQEWEPGAPFPKHILCKDEDGRFLFGLTLLRKEKVALEVAGTVAPLQAGPSAAPPTGK